MKAESVRNHAPCFHSVQYLLRLRDLHRHLRLNNHPTSLNDLAALYANQGQYEQAEPLYQRALAICEQQLGPLHPDTVRSLNNLAGLYKRQGKYEQAESLLQTAQAIREPVLGSDYPNTVATLENYADLLQKTKHAREAVEPSLLQDLNMVSRSKSSQEISHQHVRDLLESGAKKPSLKNIAHHKAKSTMAKQSRKNNRRRK